MRCVSLLQAAEGFFIGDSIAAATAQTIGMRGSAHHSVSLRRNAIAPQFQRIPKGAVALMTLGLNDAAIPVQAMRKDIETVIEGALKTGERIVWIGPPCVLKSWDKRAKEMDDYLRAAAGDDQHPVREPARSADLQARHALERRRALHGRRLPLCLAEDPARLHLRRGGGMAEAHPVHRGLDRAEASHEDGAHAPSLTRDRRRLTRCGPRGLPSPTSRRRFFDTTEGNPVEHPSWFTL